MGDSSVKTDAKKLFKLSAFPLSSLTFSPLISSCSTIDELLVKERVQLYNVEFLWIF